MNLKSGVLLLLVGSMGLLTSGCGKSETTPWYEPKRLNITFDVVCLDGIEHWFTPYSTGGAMSPHYKRDGTLQTCD